MVPTPSTQLSTTSSNRYEEADGVAQFQIIPAPIVKNPTIATNSAAGVIPTLYGCVDSSVRMIVSVMFYLPLSVVRLLSEIQE